MPTGVYIRTTEYREIMRKAMKGRVFTEAWKQKMCENHVGMSGRKISEEHRRKLSEGRLGNKRACKFGKGLWDDAEYRKEWHKKYYEKNLERLRLYMRSRSLKRRVTKEGTGHKFIIPIIQKVYEDNIKKYGTLTCYLCEEPIEFKKDSLEHKTPLCRGGNNEYENLAVAHISCNRKKAKRTEEEYKEVLNGTLC